jgi:hypothetical protein
MATWRKVIVSGSQADLLALFVQNSVTASVFSGSQFSGSFFGNGAGLTGVTATPTFPSTAKTDLATTDKFFVNDDAGDATSGNKKITYANLVADLAGAGAGTSNLTSSDAGDSLALTPQIAVTGVSASFTGSLTGALIGTASWANSATNAVNTSITDTTTGTGPYYITFKDATTGFAVDRIDSTGLTYNATNNALTTGQITASFTGSLTGALIGTASWATAATTATNATNTTITDTTTGTGPYYITFTSTNTGNTGQLVDSTGLTYNATNNALTVGQITGSLTGSVTGVLIGTASWASNVTTATNATNATNVAVTDTTTGTGPYYITFVDGTTGNRATLVDSTTLTYNSTTNGLTTGQVTASSGVLVSAGGVNVSNGGVTVTAGGLTVNAGNAAFAANVSVQGDLLVAGTASFQNTQNLLVGDRFIALASGSTTLTDGGIVIVSSNSGGGMSGSAWYLETGTGTNYGTYGRWAAAFGVHVSASNTVTQSEFAVTVNVATNTDPSAAPVWGGSTNGSGNMWINDAQGTIWIYA